MKFLSSFSAALMLGAAAISMVAAPAADAKKEKKQKAPKFKPSKAFGPLFNDSIKTARGGDASATATAEAGLRAAIANDDDRHLFGQFLLVAGSAQKNAKTIVEGLDLLLASPRSTTEDKQVYYVQKGAQAFNGLKDYRLAAQSFEMARELGSTHDGLEYNISNAYALQNDYPTAVKWMRMDVESKLAAGTAVSAENYRILASHAIKSKQPQIVTDALQFVLQHNPTTDFWHDAILLHLNARDLNGQESLDLLRLMRETKSMRYAQHYAEYTEAANPRRYPSEVASVLEEGFAAGTISKTEVSFSEAYSTSKSSSSGLRSAWDRDEREAMASAKGYLALLTGDDMYADGDYARAAKLYKAALAKGNIVDSSGRQQADRATLRLGMAQVKLGDYEAAKATLAGITSGERKEIAEFWTIFAEGKAAEATAIPAASASAS